MYRILSKNSPLNLLSPIKLIIQSIIADIFVKRSDKIFQILLRLLIFVVF